MRVGFPAADPAAIKAKEEKRAREQEKLEKKMLKEFQKNQPAAPNRSRRRRPEGVMQEQAESTLKHEGVALTSGPFPCWNGLQIRPQAILLISTTA